jgi:glyoxylase-like metal-dependent hydrolase (beta-lactamase superfamily II)
MQQITPDIFHMRLPTIGFPPGHANSYLVRGTGEYILIDTGWDTQEMHDFIARELHEMGIGYKDINRIILTHAHTDHAGLAGALREKYGTPIYLHKDAIPAIKFRFKLIDGQYTDTFIPRTDELLCIHGAPPDQLGIAEKRLPEMRFPPFPDVTLNGGETIDTGNFQFRILYSPGHSPGHITIYEPEKQIAISGDNVLPTLITNVGFHLQFVDNPLREYLNSLQALKRLSVKLVLPGHEYSFANLAERIDELVGKHVKKTERILQTFHNGIPMTSYDISLAVSWPQTHNRAAWLDFAPWDKRFAMLENIAHLQELVFSGKLEKYNKNGIIYYNLSQNNL